MRQALRQCSSASQCALAGQLMFPCLESPISKRNPVFLSFQQGLKLFTWALLMLKRQQGTVAAEGWLCARWSAAPEYWAGLWSTGCSWWRIFWTLCNHLAWYFLTCLTSLFGTGRTLNCPRVCIAGGGGPSLWSWCYWFSYWQLQWLVFSSLCHAN